jgi:hypothetical protein
MCPDSGRVKMLFETKAKAQRFIDWNGHELPYGGDRLRPYYCPACCGWHISHLEYRADYEGRTDKTIEAYKNNKKWSKKKRGK